MTVYETSANKDHCQMKTEKVQVKLFAAQGLEESLESYIPVFHRWIRESTLGELMIDVADYTHVPRGMGVLLVGHGSDIAIDEGEGRPGLLYCRKRGVPEGTPLVSDALSRALSAAKLLDEDAEVAGPRKFGTSEILFRFPERLHLANDEDSFSQVRPAIEQALGELLSGASYQLSREGEPREPLTVRARVAS